MNSPTRANMHPRIRQSFEQSIAEYGMAVMMVADNPSFSYTVGLLEPFGFELLAVGLPPQHAHIIFNGLHASLKQGFKIELGKIISGEENVWANLPLKFELCDPDDPRIFDEYCVQAEAWWGRKFPVYQLVYSDREGRLPGDPAYDHPYMDRMQPLLYRNVQ